MLNSDVIVVIITINLYTVFTCSKASLTFIFTAQRYDAMHKRGLCCRPVSVCPSVTLLDSIQTVEDIVILVVRPSDPLRRY